MPTKRKSELLAVYAFGPMIYASHTNGRIVVTIRIAASSSDLIASIISGELRGLSPEMIIREWECSICHDSFEKCVHIAGEKYEGAECETIARNIKFTAGSIVNVPKDPRCRITDLLLVKATDDGPEQLEWYGFELNSEIDRFKSIQSAFEHRLISQKAAFHFGEFFSVNLFGKANYP